MSPDSLIDQDLALGLLVVGVGALLALFPGPLVAMNETFDAVGSTRSGADVEPARWRLLLTRAAGAAVVLAGLWYLAATYGLVSLP